MERTVMELMGGQARPSDPRRFVIEAMLGAMHADGIVDERELVVIERQLAEHPWFSALGDAARTLLDLSSDALKHAGSAARRAPAIAKGLPARIHRLTAYGMAVEVAVADGELAPAEQEFLGAIGRALRIDSSEADKIACAVEAGALTDYLAERFRWIAGLAPVMCDLIVWRSIARGTLAPDPRSVIGFLAALPDLQTTRSELEPELSNALQRPRRTDRLARELDQLAGAVPDRSDRYWIMVYALAAELPAMVPSWRVIPFITELQRAFELDDAAMQNAVIDALSFPAAMPRPD
ncbi:MAG: TerB family tellurite resistance protein [Kofleriaceae bacterium]